MSGAAAATRQRVWIAVGVLVALLFIGGIVLMSATHGKDPATSDYGALLLDGSPTLVSCGAGGISGIELAEVDGNPWGPVVLTVESLPGAQLRPVVNLGAVANGYRYDPGPGSFGSGDLYVTELRGESGRNRLISVMPLKPAELLEGQVRLASGKSVSLADFAGAHPDCGLPTS
jgi:hypothetical protein